MLICQFSKAQVSNIVKQGLSPPQKIQKVIYVFVHLTDAMLSFWNRLLLEMNSIVFPFGSFWFGFFSSNNYYLMRWTETDSERQSKALNSYFKKLVSLEWFSLNLSTRPDCLKPTIFVLMSMNCDLRLTTYWLIQYLEPQAFCHLWASLCVSSSVKLVNRKQNRKFKEVIVVGNLQDWQTTDPRLASDSCVRFMFWLKVHLG